MHRIIQKVDGTFRCEVEVQDGTERWTEHDLSTALKAVKEAEKFLNGNKIKKRHIPVYREVAQVQLERIQ